MRVTLYCSCIALPAPSLLGLHLTCFAMLVCRTSISSHLRPSVSALSCVTFYPLSVVVRGILARSIVASATVSSPQSRLSVITCCRIFPVPIQAFSLHVRFTRSVSSVRTRRSGLWFRRFPPGPVGFGSAVLPFPFGSRLAAPGAMRRSSPRAPFRQARCLSRRSPRLQASAIAPREHFFLGPGTAHAALPIFRPRKGIEPTRR